MFHIFLSLLVPTTSLLFNLNNSSSFSSHSFNHSLSVVSNISSTDTIDLQHFAQSEGINSTVPKEAEKQEPKDVCGACTDVMHICESTGCQHKSLFSGTGFELRDGVTTGIVFVLFAATAAAGTGGGGVLVPVFIVLEQFLPKDAVAISQSTIFGGSLANLIWNVRARHPLADRPLISLELGLMMEPTTLAGTVAGVLLNRVLPAWALLTILVLLLGLTLVRATQNAWKKRAKERSAFGAHLQDKEPSEALRSSPSHSRSLIVKTDPSDLWQNSLEEVPVSAPGSRLCPCFGGKVSTTERSGCCCASRPLTLQALLEREKSWQFRYLSVYVATWATIFGFSLTKGGTSGESIVGVRCGAVWFWVLNAAVLPCVLMLQCFIARHLARLDTKKVMLEYEFLVNDVRWSGKNTVGLPCVSYLVGVFAGMLGIGGGLFKAPLLNEMGVDSQVSGATCSFMIFFTSSISMTQYLIYGALKTDYALWFGGIGFVSSVVGQAINSCILARYHTSSHLDLGVAGIIACSFVLLLVQGILTIQEDLATGAMGFSELCVAGGATGGE